MKVFTLLLIVATFIMGVYDGGNITAAILISIFFLPAIFSKKEGNAK